MALTSYILRDRLGTFYFRRVVPPELRSLMPAPWASKANRKASLGTKDPKMAKRAATSRLARCMADFKAAERTKRGEPSIAVAVLLNPEDIE